MITLTDYIVATFGVYYLSYSISNPEIDGPWNILKKLRGMWTEQNDWKARGIRCCVCVSFWVGLAAALALTGFGFISVWACPVVWLGLAGGSVVLARYWQR